MADSAWFVEMYERRYSAVLAYAARRVGRDAGHDVAADVFLVLWRRKVQLETEVELAWLYATARRVVANAIRSDQRRLALSLRARAALAGGCVPMLDGQDAVGARIDVRRALVTLSPRDQEALLLAEWEGVTDLVGAEVTGCSPTAFRARVHRARRRLAVALERPAEAQQAQRGRPTLATRSDIGDDEGVPR